MKLTADFGLSRLIENYIEEMFNEKNVSFVNRQKLWNFYNEKLSAAVDVGYSPKTKHYDKELADSLKNSIAKFSAFKETSFNKDLENLLTTDGKLTPKSEFRKEAQKLSADYNYRWIETERHQTIANANMAQKWKEFEQDVDLYPNVKLISVHDARVRPEHKVLDGTIRPYNDPFWDSNTPPLDWGCRCNIEQTDEEPTEIKGGLQMKIEFQNNPGKTGEIFGGSAYEEKLSTVDKKETLENLQDFQNLDSILKDEKELYKRFEYTEDEIKDQDFYKEAVKINPNIRPSEAYSIFNYSIEGFDVNSYIYNNEHLDEYWSAFRNNLNRGLDKLPNYEGTVYRGTKNFSAELISKYEKAFNNKTDIIHDYFMSTSTDKSITEDFGGQISFKIKSKTGKHIEPMAMWKEEREVLFKTDTRFKVVGFQKNEYDGFTEVLMELEEI